MAQLISSTSPLKLAVVALAHGVEELPLLPQLQQMPKGRTWATSTSYVTIPNSSNSVR